MSTPAADGRALEDLLDELVARYSDELAAGRRPARAGYLERVPAQARPGLERCLKMIDAGLASPPSAALPLAPGLELGRYQLSKELGRGGMALVFLAQDRELRRPVALKILRPGLALERRHVDRFRREALAIARLKHASIVQIHDVGELSGFHYLAMEYVEGPTLARVLEALPRERRWTGEELARAAGVPALAGRGRTLEQVLAALLAPVAEALHAAHGLGIVHRDVKPSNILIRPDGTAVVADFGLAKQDGDPALSLTGDTIGTPYYMSPEQAWMAEVQVDGRSDVYSLGVCLFEALAGRRPFEGRNLLEVFERIRTTIPPSLKSLEPRVSRDAAAVVRRAMARAPEDRYSSAADLASDLRALAELRPTQARLGEGGALRRAWASCRLHLAGVPGEYRSARTFLGVPLVHVISGPRLPGRPRRVARGWFASSPEVAVGGIACGQTAFGGIACGGIACGLFAWGGLALGFLVGFGGLAMGLLSMGGLSAGYLAFGGVAVGYGAVGGLARGVYAMGGDARGTHVISEGRRDLGEQEFFDAVLGFDVPWFHLGID
jgi:hypothetical protein